MRIKFILGVLLISKISLAQFFIPLEIIEGTNIKKGNIILVTSLTNVDGFSKANVIEDDKSKIISLSDLEKYTFKQNNLSQFWQVQALQKGTYDNILKKGYQYDLRKELEEDALEYLNKIGSSGLICNDSYLENYLYSLLLKLYPNTAYDARPGNLNITILNETSPNTFIFPNGTLVITTGLLTTVNSEEELVAVLAHEIAHYALDHSILNVNKAIQREKSAAFWAALATGLALTADAYLAANNAYYTPGALTMSTAVISFGVASLVIERLGLKYNIDQENEADMVAVELLKYLNYEPEALATALSKIKNYNVLKGNYFALSGGGTHPEIDSRIKKIGTPKPFETKGYDKKFSTIITFNAIFEFNNKVYKASEQLVDRNIKSGLATVEDYILKSMIILRTYDNEQKNQEALQLIIKAKELCINPNMNLVKQEALVFLRLNKNADAKQSLEAYQKILQNEYDRLGDIKNESLWLTTKRYLDNEIDWSSKLIFKVERL